MRQKVDLFGHGYLSNEYSLQVLFNSSFSQEMMTSLLPYSFFLAGVRVGVGVGVDVAALTIVLTAKLASKMKRGDAIFVNGCKIICEKKMNSKFTANCTTLLRC